MAGWQAAAHLACSNSIAPLQNKFHSHVYCDYMSCSSLCSTLSERRCNSMQSMHIIFLKGNAPLVWKVDNIFLLHCTAWKKQTFSLQCCCLSAPLRISYWLSAYISHCLHTSGSSLWSSSQHLRCDLILNGVREYQRNNRGRENMPGKPEVITLIKAATRSQQRCTLQARSRFRYKGRETAFVTTERPVVEIPWE